MKRTMITAAAVLLAAAGANAKTYDMKCGSVTVNEALVTAGLLTDE